MDAIYDRDAYFDEKSAALAEWHVFLRGLLQKEFGNVDWVEFYGRRMDVAALKKVTMIKGRKRSFIYDFYG